MSSSWTPTQTSKGDARIAVKFRYADCTHCETRYLCTRSKKGSKAFTLKSLEAQKVLETARVNQEQPEWRERYKARSGIEATMSQGVRAHDLRRSRYRGLRKTALQHVAKEGFSYQRAASDGLVGWFSHCTNEGIELCSPCCLGLRQKCPIRGQTQLCVPNLPSSLAPKS